MPQSGFGYSSQPVTLPPETLMSDPSSMSVPTISAATRNATSSQESADGVTPCDSPVGPMTDLFGQALAPASRSASRVTSVAQMMSATYGLRSFASSASVALQQSLANRLQERLDSRGSTMFALTWKAQATPQRRQICRLVASALRTFDPAYGGSVPIPTPTATDSKGASLLNQRRLALRGHRSSLRDWCRFNWNYTYPPVAIARELMGFPADWDDCAPTATRSSRKSRPSL
jgi:hypothetical protein